MTRVRFVVRTRENGVPNLVFAVRTVFLYFHGLARLARTALDTSLCSLTPMDRATLPHAKIDHVVPHAKCN